MHPDFDQPAFLFGPDFREQKKFCREKWPILNRLGWIWAVTIQVFARCVNLMEAIPCLRTAKNIGIRSVSMDSATLAESQRVVGRKSGPSCESTPIAEAKGVAQFPYRILVVDDDLSIRETAVEVLESQGYEVLTAADGVDGLHALSKSLPDLIISDLNMPRMSGFEFLAVVRKRFPHIATIAMSGELPYGSRSIWDCGGRFPAEGALHSQTTVPGNWKAIGCFTDQTRRRKN